MGIYQIDGLKVSWNKKYLKTDEDYKRGFVLLPVSKITHNPRKETRKIIFKKITNIETGEVILDKPYAGDGKLFLRKSLIQKQGR